MNSAKEIMNDMHKALAGSSEGDKTLWENEWLEVREHEDWYTYIHQVKSDGKAVAVLGYSEDPFSPLGRFEVVPCHHDGIALCSLTGMVDKGEKFVEAAVREFKEESGVDVEESELEDLGEVRPSKVSDTVVHLYAVKVSHQDGKMTGEGDGTKAEQGSFCRFISVSEAINSKDPLMSTMTVKLMEKKNMLSYLT